MVCTIEKRVVDVEWSSLDGVVLYREVYNDGSRSALISAGFETNDPMAERKMLKIKQEILGQTVQR